MKPAKTSAVPCRTGSTRWKPGPARHPRRPARAGPAQVRSRDVLEHIERVVHHVRRLEQAPKRRCRCTFGAEQPHQRHHAHAHGAHRRVLPLNLIAGIFGMNFEFVPLIHKADGFWWAVASMLAIAVALVALFWRKQYLAHPAIRVCSKSGVRTTGVTTTPEGTIVRRSWSCFTAGPLQQASRVPEEVRH